MPQMLPARFPCEFGGFAVSHEYAPTGDDDFSEGMQLACKVPANVRASNFSSLLQFDLAASFHAEGVGADLAVHRYGGGEGEPPGAAEAPCAAPVHLEVAADDGEVGEDGICRDGDVAQGAHGEAAGACFELDVSHVEVGMAVQTLGGESGGGYMRAPPAFIAADFALRDAGSLTR